MASGRSSRTTILAGLFVIVSIALGVGVVIVLSGVADLFKSKKQYIVRFSVLDGADGLEPGSFVKVGGQKVGRVTGWDFTTERPDSVTPSTRSIEPGADDAIEAISVDVTIEVDSRIRLYEDATVYLVRPLLGASAQINIVSVGKGGDLPAGRLRQGTSEVLEPGEILIGELGPPGFIATSDYKRIQGIIANVESVTGTFDKTTLPEFNEMLRKSAQVVESVAQTMPEWKQDVTDTLENVKVGSEKFPKIAADAEAAISDIRSGTQDARDFIAAAKKTIDDNRQSIDDTIAGVKKIVQTAETEWLGKITKALDDATTGLDSFVRMGRDAEAVFAESMPAIREIVADGALAAHQLKMATIEVRASPWRLLYQPTKKELENELLYNSVRSYSDAVGRLKSSADALNAATARARATVGPDGRPVAPELGGLSEQELAALVNRVEESLATYKSEEKKFLDRWLKPE